MKTLITFHISLLIVFSAVGQSTWQESDYNKFTYQTITNFSAINDTIVPERFDYKLLNAAIFFETNRQRALYGLKPLKHDSRLESCAQGHSQDMANYNFFSHTSTVPGKYSLSDRAGRYGISETYIGENIHDIYILQFNGEAYIPASFDGYFKTLSGKRIPMHSYQSLAFEIVKGWMNSPGHKANILNTNYSHLGVGNGLHYTGIGIDRIPWVKSTQNFAKFNNPVLVARKTTSSSYNQYSQTYSYKKTYSSTLPYKNENYKYEVIAPKKNPSRLCIGICVAGVTDSFDGFRSGKMDYQLSGQLGGYVGEKGHGRSFWGVFPSVDLTDGYPFALEFGTVLSRFLKFSAGGRMLPNDKSNWPDYTFAPSATVGIQLHLGAFYVAVDMNGYYFNSQTEKRFIASAGFCI
jgi:uncharacterized protein YkwD